MSYNNKKQIFFWHISCSYTFRNHLEVAGVKRALVYSIGAAVLLTAIAFAADKPASDAVKADSAKANTVKIAKMNATGKVIEISEKAISIERTVKDKVETMIFVLDKPTENIAVSDAVKISYIEKDGTLVASRVAKANPRKPEKKENIKAVDDKAAKSKK